MLSITEMLNIVMESDRHKKSVHFIRACHIDAISQYGNVKNDEIWCR
jgi:hypothetical protein